MHCLTALFLFLTILTPASSQTNDTSQTNGTLLQTSDPLPATPIRDSTDDATIHYSITQLLSFQRHLLDTKNFPALSAVYSADAVLNGSGTGALVGLPAIIDFYTQTFRNESLKTQHTSDTVLAYDFTPNTAKSVSYATVVYFGPPVLERGGLLFPNESVVFREKIANQYNREEDGSWRIKLQTEFTILGIEGRVNELLGPV